MMSSGNQPKLISVVTRLSKRGVRDLRLLGGDIQFALSRHAKAHYIGCLNINNLGDEAVYASIRALFAHNIDFFTGELPHPAVLPLWYRTPYDAVFLGGGTLIKKTSRYQDPIRLYTRLYSEAKFIVFGTGVADEAMWESFGVKTDVEGWREVLQKADFIGVRGPLSQMRLQDWGVQGDVQVIGDPAIWFARPTLVTKPLQKRIGLNLGPASGFLFGQDETKVMEFGAELLKRLHKEGWQITLFPVISDDIAYLKRTVELSGIPRPTMHMKVLDIDSMLSALAFQDVFVGEKLHSVIFSHCVHTPAIMLEYRTKCRDYMMSVRQEQWGFRTDQLDSSEVYESILELYENNAVYQRDIFDQTQQLQNSLVESAKRVRDLMGLLAH